MQQGQIRVPPLSFANKVLIISCIGFFILQNIFTKFVGFPLEAYLGLSGERFFSGHLYELFTYPLMGRGLWEVLFNSLLLWFIGSDLENSWGTKRYLSFLLVAVLGAGVTYLLIYLGFLTSYAAPLTGLSGIVNFLMLAYAILYPNRLFSFMFVFPIKAKHFCMIIIGMEVFLGVFSPMGAISLSHLGSMAAGYAYMVYLSRPRKRPKPRGKANLYLVKDPKKGPKDDSPKYWH
ncbi:MAG: rhomboid family intramembrane serine protease [Deltaproteobacteria bacterium]|nr:MAG: rhomboid family intramembrane serine protease [Deltaproteobacteria bacterium]